VWRAAYELDLGERKVAYEVDVESLECPVARVTVESQRLIGEYSRAKRVRESLGGVVYGADAGRWPARWFDAVECIELESQRAEAAMHGAARGLRRG
jgi:hypothetical protein